MRRVQEGGELGDGHTQQPTADATGWVRTSDTNSRAAMLYCYISCICKNSVFLHPMLEVWKCDSLLCPCIIDKSSSGSVRHGITEVLGEIPVSNIQRLFTRIHSSTYIEAFI